MPKPQLLSIQSLPLLPSPAPRLQVPGPSASQACLSTVAHGGGGGEGGAVKGAGSAGQEEELEFVKNIFIINKQGWKGAGEAAEDFDGQKDSGILAPSPHSDGFYLCLRRDILGSRWPSGSLSPGLMLGAPSQRGVCGSYL